MTERRWLTSSNVRVLLEMLEGRSAHRRLRLFACALFRPASAVPGGNPDKAAWNKAEQFVDGQIDWRELQRAWWEARCTNPIMHILSHPMTMGGAQPLTATIASAAEAIQAEKPSEAESVECRGQQIALLRHVFGNPFRTYPAPPSWPATVVGLAGAQYDGLDNRLVLADALEEAGHLELAGHLRQEQWHPKGCWVVDLILGKE